MNKNIKKLIFCGKVLGLCTCLLAGLNQVKASITSNLPTSTISDTFPESYTMYINKMKEVYPNATFKAVYTGLNFNTVLKHECYEKSTGISLVPSSYSSVWKKDGKNIYKDGNFVVASKNAVAYVLDPRNMLYEERIFQFEGLTYNESITASAIEKVLSNSPMVGTYAKKYKKAGKWIDMDMSYSEIINKVGKEQNVSGMYIASLIIQETSGDIVNNGSINGSNSTYSGVYNFFNIGATPNEDGTGAVLNGLKYAKSNGWTNPYNAISGGINQIKKNYIDYGQDTIYFQKFDVNNPYGNAKALMAYQYQTNIIAPKSESLISYNAYKKMGLLNSPFIFYIPVYNNMPEDPTPYPEADTATFENDNTKVYLDDMISNGTDSFNIRSSANSEIDNIIYTLDETKEGMNNRTILTRLKKGNGYSWDYVEFVKDEKTIKGYVYSDYVKTYNYTKVEKVTIPKESISLQIGETYDLVANVLPTNATFKNLIWSSNNENIATVTNGKITAIGEGEAIITVLSEDQLKSATCRVSVTQVGPEIITDEEEYTVKVGYQITPIVSLKNIEDYTIISSNADIAKVVNKSIEGVSEGKTTFIVKATNVDFSKELTINVVADATQSDDIHEDIIIVLETDINMEPQTKVLSAKEKLNLCDMNLVIKDVNNNELTEDNLLGTDTKIFILNSNNKVYKTMRVLVRGDVTGDGEVNSGDLFRIVEYLKPKNVAFNIKAGDVTKDGEVNSGDLFAIVQYLIKGKGIDFN